MSSIPSVLTSETTLRQKAYAIIQNKLLSGEIRAGDLVSELALAAEIGMSRTPVREAIGQLEIEGLFDKVPRVGTLVRLPKQRELSEMYGVREALESFVASGAVSSLTGQQFEALEAHQKALWQLIEESENEAQPMLSAAQLARFFEADIGFHSVIIGTSDNAHILKIISEFRLVQRVFEYGRMAYDLSLVSSAAREHNEVLEALKNGDAAKARHAMALHIRSSCAHAMKHYELATKSSNAQSAPLSGADEDAVSPSRLKQRPRRRNPIAA